jgi:hypothetical protein
MELDSHLSYLAQRWEAGCHNIAALYRKLVCFYCSRWNLYSCFWSIGVAEDEQMMVSGDVGEDFVYVFSYPLELPLAFATLTTTFAGTWTFTLTDTLLPMACAFPPKSLRSVVGGSVKE